MKRAPSKAMQAGLDAVDELEALQPPQSLLAQATPEQAQLLHALSDEAERRARIARLFKPQQSTNQGRE